MSASSSPPQGHTATAAMVWYDPLQHLTWDDLVRTILNKLPVSKSLQVHHDTVQRGPFSLVQDLPVELLLVHYEAAGNKQTASWSVRRLGADPRLWVWHFHAFLHWGLVGNFYHVLAANAVAAPLTTPPHTSPPPTTTTTTHMYTSAQFHREFQRSIYVQRFPEQTCVVLETYVGYLDAHDALVARHRSSFPRDPIAWDAYKTGVRTLRNALHHELPAAATTTTATTDMFRCNDAACLTATPWSLLACQRESVHSLDDIGTDVVIVQNMSKHAELSTVLCPKESLRKHVGALDICGSQYVSLREIGLPDIVVRAQSWWNLIETRLDSLRFIRLVCAHCLYVPTKVNLRATAPVSASAPRYPDLALTRTTQSVMLPPSDRHAPVSVHSRDVYQYQTPQQTTDSDPAGSNMSRLPTDQQCPSHTWLYRIVCFI